LARAGYAASALIACIGVATACAWYLEGRTWIVRIELVVPIALGLVPAAIVYILTAAFDRRP
jgi:hypothetical protein